MGSSGGVESPDTKIKQLEILIRRDQDHESDDDHENDEEDHESDEDHLDVFKKQLGSLSVEELNEATMRAGTWECAYFVVDNEKKEATFVQYLATQTRKLDRLQLLLNHGVDPRAVTEDLGDTPLEIAAINENTEAFNLLSPFYEESTKKNMAQLWIWALTDWVPSAAFAQLFASVPLDEVNSFTILKYNLLQILAYQGQRHQVAFLLEQGVDPEAKASPERQCPMKLAWKRNHVDTMVELAKYTEAEPKIRSSSLWSLVEKEQERSWRQEVDGLLQKQQKEVLSLQKQIENQQKQMEDQQNQIESQQKLIEKQSKLLKWIAKATGVEVED